MNFTELNDYITLRQVLEENQIDTDKIAIILTPDERQKLISRIPLYGVDSYHLNDVHVNENIYGIRIITDKGE